MYQEFPSCELDHGANYCDIYLGARTGTTRKRKRKKSHVHYKQVSGQVCLSSW
jgi:hypothetical protein